MREDNINGEAKFMVIGHATTIFEAGNRKKLPNPYKNVVTVIK